MSPWRTGDVVLARGGGSRFRLAYLAAHAFELALAVAATIAGVAFFLSHEALSFSAVGILANRPLAYTWTSLLLVGGVATTIGLWRLSPAIEVVGLCLLIPGYLINGIAAILYRHVPSLGAAAFILVGLVALLRVRTIIGLAQIGARQKANQ